MSSLAKRKRGSNREDQANKKPKQQTRDLTKPPSPDTLPEDIEYVLETQPPDIKGEMKSYQLEGFSFLTWMARNRFPCILGDEMGLGKTLQTIAFLELVYSGNGGLHLNYLQKRPALVICPLSVLNSWSQEVSKWSQLSALPMHGAVSERTRLKNIFMKGSYHIVLTTYDVYKSESGWFNSRTWGAVILDEGHKIKSLDTQLSRTIRGIGGLWKLILSGTTVQNNMVELWSLLHWLYPKVFTLPTLDTFKSSFDLAQGMYDSTFISKAGKLLSLIMRRRTKVSLGPDIFPVPPKFEITLTVPLSPAQRFWYLALLKRIDLTLLKNDPEEGTQRETQSRYKQLMNLLMQLRKVCNHPYTVLYAEPDPYIIGEHIVDTSTKLQLLDKLILSLRPEQKILIFSGFTSMLDYVQDFLSLRNISHARLDGSTPRARRTLDMRLFQQENHSPYRAYVISTRAGGLGITLTAADTVLMIDSDWNPQVDIQAIARAHRIGQTKPVNVYRFVVQGSVEEQMLRRVQKKLYLVSKVDTSFCEDPNLGTEDEAERMTMDELRKVLNAGKRAVGNSFTEEDTEVEKLYEDWRSKSFQDIVEEAKTKAEEEKQNFEMSINADRTMEEEEVEFFGSVEKVETRLFEGKKVERSMKDIADEWWRVSGKRERKQRTTMVGGYSVASDSLGCPQREAVTTITSDPKVLAKFASSKKKTRTWEHENWCLYCRDGGDLFTCQHCPRVAHSQCAGLRPTDLKGMISWRCPQHACGSCGRNAGECGGLIFRCQTCPGSFCEECLPTNELFALGEEAPEFIKLGFSSKSSIFYIRCDECVAQFQTEGKQAHDNWFGDDLDWRDDPIVGTKKGKIHEVLTLKETDLSVANTVKKEECHDDEILFLAERKSGRKETKMGRKTRISSSKIVSIPSSISSSRMSSVQFT